VCDWHRSLSYRGPLNCFGQGSKTPSHIRTVPMPDWVKRAIDEWTVSAGLTSGSLFRAINKAGRMWAWVHAKGDLVDR
jgi:hypothetical protein